MNNVDVYITDHQYSKIIGGAFQEGCNGRRVAPGKLYEGIPAVYGILRGCGEIIKQCDWLGRDYYHVDLGYLGRGHFDGYYRVSKNGLQADIGDEEYSPERFEKIGTRLRPWRRTGTNILVAPLSANMGRFLGIDTYQWCQAVKAEIRRWTARPILMKEKHEGEISSALDDCWCLVTHASNAAVDALVEGVPVITLGPSAVEGLSWDFSNIEKPAWFNREPYFWALANHQWNLDEFRSGKCWNDLQSR